MLFVRASPSHQISEFLAHSRGGGTLVVHHVVQHIASLTSTMEFLGNFVVLARSHLAQVVFNFSFSCDVGFGIGFSVGEFSHLDTLVDFSHHVNIDTVVDEWELLSIQHFSFKSNSHVSFS